MNFDTWAEDLAKHINSKNTSSSPPVQPAQWVGWCFPETHKLPPDRKLCVILIDGLHIFAAPSGIPFIKFGFYNVNHWVYFDSNATLVAIEEDAHRICAWQELSLEQIFPALRDYQ